MKRSTFNGICQSKTIDPDIAFEHKEVREFLKRTVGDGDYTPKGVQNQLELSGILDNLT